MRYSLVKAFVPALAGKFCMSLIVAYGGRFSIDLLKSIFGLESDWITLFIGFVIAVILLIILLLLMFKVNWEKYFMKYLKWNLVLYPPILSIILIGILRIKRKGRDIAKISVEASRQLPYNLLVSVNLLRTSLY